MPALMAGARIADQSGVTERRMLETDRRRARILIADRNLLFRRGLRTVLSSESGFTLLDDAVDANEVLAKVPSEKPDILAVSLEMLGPNARQFGYFLRKAKPDVSIFVLTSNDSPENLQQSIEAGAKGYMVKDSSPAQFVKAFRQLASGTNNDSVELSSTVPDLRALAEQTPAAVRPHVLTAREQEVVRLLAEGRTVKEVAYDLSLSIKTVEAHKLNLMRKLNIHNRSSLIDYAVREGMVSA
ncbi:MAG: LuxR C-terminal-related transcriptional regulator [Bryobacteraceae bacterium]